MMSFDGLNIKFIQIHQTKNHQDNHNSISNNQLVSNRVNADPSKTLWQANA